MVVRSLLVALLLVVSPLSNAETRFGVGVTQGNYSVEDPDGSADSTTEASIFGVVTMPMSRNWPDYRYWFQVEHKSFELDASTSEVGQDVTSTSLSAIIQRSFSVSSDFRPWLGLGAGAGINDYDGRHTIDEDGFLKDRFDDRSNTSMYLILNAGISFRKLDNGVFIGTSINYERPIDDGIESTNLNVFLLY